MILLEDKLAIFNKIVYQKNKEIWMKKIAEVKADYQKAQKEKEIEIANMKNEIIKRRENLAKQKSYEMISDVNQEKRILELQKNEEILEHFINDLYRKLEEFSKTEDYFKFEENRFNQIIEDFDEGKYIISILDRDSRLKDIFIEIAKKRNIELSFDQLEESSIGGFMISDEEKTYNVDCSLKAKVEDSKYQIGKLLHFTLKEAGVNK